MSRRKRLPTIVRHPMAVTVPEQTAFGLKFVTHMVPGYTCTITGGDGPANDPIRSAYEEHVDERGDLPDSIWKPRDGAT